MTILSADQKVIKDGVFPLQVDSWGAKIGEFPAARRWCASANSNIWQHHLRVLTWCGDTTDARLYVGWKTHLRIPSRRVLHAGKPASVTNA